MGVSEENLHCLKKGKTNYADPKSILNVVMGRPHKGKEPQRVWKSEWPRPWGLEYKKSYREIWVEQKNLGAHEGRKHQQPGKL